MDFNIPSKMPLAYVFMKLNDFGFQDEKVWLIMIKYEKTKHFISFEMRNKRGQKKETLL